MKTFLFLTALASFTASASDFILEASGVTKVGHSILIAGDEDVNQLWILKDGVSVQVKVKGKWDDMEGLATIDDSHFFGITSQSLTKKGKSRPEREQLFVFSLGEKIRIERSFSPRSMLLDALEASLGSELDLKQVRTGTPDTGGLNVEGLAYRDGVLYVGLRSPLTKSGEAILIEVKNAETAPEVYRVRTLKLGGAGIRSLDVDGEDLIILSGSSTDESERFGLFKLNLSKGSLLPEPVSGFEKLLRPEGVIAETPGNYLFVQDFEAPAEQPVIMRLPR